MARTVDSSVGTLKLPVGTLEGEEMEQSTTISKLYITVYEVNKNE